MSLDLNNDYNQIKEKLNAYKTTVDLKRNENQNRLNSIGDSFEQSKSESLKQLNDLGDKSQRLQTQVKNQFDEIVEMVRVSMPQVPGSDSSTINFLIKSLLTSAQNTKS